VIQTSLPLFAMTCLVSTMAVEPISGSEWKDGIGAHSVLPEAALAGALPAPLGRSPHTSRLCALAAAMKLANSGWGSKGLDLSSGWNWTPMNQG
jgi:hypothetical protein